MPTPLEAWERWEADRNAEVKPERKEMEFEEERNKKVVLKNILTLAEKQ